MAAPQSYDFVNMWATEEHQVRNLRDRVRFHYFNPNGLYERKRVINDAINDAVTKGHCKSGAILAHGGRAAEFHEDEMRELVYLRRVNRIRYQVWREMYIDHIERAADFLNGVNTRVEQA